MPPTYKALNKLDDYVLNQVVICFLVDHTFALLIILLLFCIVKSVGELETFWVWLFGSVMDVATVLSEPKIRTFALLGMRCENVLLETVGGNI